MKKNKIISILISVFTWNNIKNILLFILFCAIFTGIISSKYFLFQNLISKEGLSNREIIAPRTIEVIDVFKTEQLKKEVASKVDPILKPAEDTYIKSNLATILKSVIDIRKCSDTIEQKKVKMGLLFDLENPSNKNFIINYLLASSDETIEAIGQKSNTILEKMLKEGITEKMFEKDNTSKLIFKHSQQNTSKSQIKVINSLLEQIIMPNMIVDEVATESAKKNAVSLVSPYTIKFEKGDKIVFQGEPVTKVKRDALSKAGYNVFEINAKGLFGIFMLVTIASGGLMYLLFYFEKSCLNKNHLFLISTLAIIVAVVSVLLPDDQSYFLLPIPAFAIILSIFINPRVSVFGTIILIMVLGVSLQFSSQTIVVLSLIGLFCAIKGSSIRYSRRSDLIRLGLETAIEMIMLISIIYIIELCVMDIDFDVYIKDLLSGAFTGLSTGIIVLGLIPLLESIFHIITPFGLSELADHNQPLLKRLQFEAPGTFAHSISLANLTESIAEAIGADPVLSRVGALYHDIGKLKRPLFFVENQNYFGIENPHTKLNPRLSKMVIMAHPRDGLELAKEYKLPSKIQDFIAQHHGETLAAYFYNEAINQEGAKNVSKDQFRYSGPKPNSKETAILMIADAVESASRTLKDHTIEEIDNLIQKIINERLNDGQLSDSPLTLKDLKIISQTLNRHIRASHHKRIKYHENIIEELDKTASGCYIENSENENMKKDDFKPKKD